MGAQFILPVLIRLVLAVEGAKVTKSVKDNVSAPSVPQLYSSENGVYASGVPYYDANYSGSQLVPIKEEHVLIQNNKGFLKDSYGNNFVESPQKFAYKMTLPQQYVKLQDLPLHLSQPLTVSGFTHAGGPQFSYGSPHKISSQASKPVHFSTSVFSDIQALAPNARLTQALGHAPQHLSSNQKPIYTSKQPYKYYTNGKNVKFQRLEQKPTNQNGNQQLKANYQKEHYNKSNVKKVSASSLSAPQKHYIVTQNGKKTPITLTTIPPLPHLLDVGLLKPLTFANPIVPQVQHYLPKINYHVPKVDEERKHHNEFVLTKTKSYDTSNVKDVAPNEDSSENNSSEEHDDDHSYEEDEVAPPYHQDRKQQKPQNQKPSINVSGNPADPEQKYTINSPGYKESFSQKVVNYGNNAESKPFVYSYDKKIQKKPVQYSFSHSSNSQPTHSNQVLINEEHNGVPKTVVYSDTPNRSQEHDDDHSIEFEEKAPRQRHQQIYQAPAPPPPNHLRAEHREVEYHIQPRPQQHPLPYDAPQQQFALPHSSPPPQAFAQIKVPIQDAQINFQPFQLQEDVHYVPPPARQHQTQQNQGFHQEQHNLPSPGNRQPPYQNQHASHESNHRDHGGPPREQNYDRVQSNNGYHFGHHDSLNNKPHNIQENNKQSRPNDVHTINQHHGNLQTHPHTNQNRHVEGPAQHGSHESRPNNQQHHGNNANNNFHHVFHSTPINQQQFINHFPQLNGFQPVVGHIHVDPSTTPQSLQQQHPPSSTHSPPPTPQQPYSSPAPTPHIIEKSRKIIIQEETPDEMHSHKEQTTAAVVDEEENNEEDFEKLYKEAALGFPAYENDRETNERDIYNPDNYAPAHHVQFDPENTPFQEYVEEGDEFPKSARLNYNDAQADTKEDYYHDYSVKKPESYMDRYKNQIDYYKMFKKHRQPSNWGVTSDERQPKKNEPYTVNAAYGFAPQPQPKEDQKGFFAQFQNAPLFEYDYSKESPRDALVAHASKPAHNVKTLFVEPQFQYGFEPIAIPNLFDSELAAMASNDHPKSDKDGKRKKVYKENWYIKKTTTSGGAPAR